MMMEGASARHSKKPALQSPTEGPAEYSFQTKRRALLPQSALRSHWSEKIEHELPRAINFLVKGSLKLAAAALFSGLKEKELMQW